MADNFEFKEMVLPQSLYQTVKAMKNYKKQTYRITPNSNASNIVAQSVVELQLPIGGLVDVSTLSLVMKGLTLTGTTPALPAWADSLISQLQIIIANQEVQTINNYNVFMNLQRNLTESPAHALSCATYNGIQNPVAILRTTPAFVPADWTNVITNWGGLLGCRKLLNLSVDNGVSSFIVRFTFAPNSVLIGTSNPTYTIGQVYGTVDTVMFSDPDLVHVIHEINGSPLEIEYDHIQHYSDTYSGAGSVSVKLPINVNCLKQVWMTARATDYQTNAALAANSRSGRVYETSANFKFDGSVLSNLYIDTGFGNFPSSSLATNAEMHAYTMQGLDLDDNYLAGSVGCTPLLGNDLVLTQNSPLDTITGGGLTAGIIAAGKVIPVGQLALPIYQNYGFGVVFCFSHRDAPAGMLMGLNTKGQGQFQLKATISAARQIDAFSVAGAILQFKRDGVVPVL
jgi:hypothetical protein